MWHIMPYDDPTNFVNPKVADLSDEYQGVMSYRTAREDWFSVDDLHMMDTHWPLKRRAVVAL